MVRRSAFTFALALPLAALGSACEDPPPDRPDGGVPQGDGGCPPGPQPSFILEISAPPDPVPADTSVSVTWTVAKEPVFKLDHPETWKTLDDSVNFSCAVARDAGPPVDLEELRCELWTSGATEVEVTAHGYATYRETLQPESIESCEHGTTLVIPVILSALADAGARR